MQMLYIVWEKVCVVLICFGDPPPPGPKLPSLPLRACMATSCTPQDAMSVANCECIWFDRHAECFCLRCCWGTACFTPARIKNGPILNPRRRICRAFAVGGGG